MDVREKESKKEKKPELSFISSTNPTQVFKFQCGRKTVYIWFQDHLALASFSNVESRMFSCHKNAPTSVLPELW